MKIKTVTGIGQCSWDYLAAIDAYPSPDSKNEVHTWMEEGGGPVATALVALRRFGVDCRFHGVIGKDKEGEKISRSLAEAGIRTGGLRCNDGASQTAFILVEEGSGRRTIFWRRPEGDPLQPEDLPVGFLAGSDLLLLDGLMSSVSLRAAKEARRLDIPVMLDAGRLRPGMAEIAALCDYVVAGEQYLLDLGWDRSLATFPSLAEQIGAVTVTVTMGAEGSLTWRQGELVRVPAFPVKAVDTTGAGDVFHGGYIYGLLEGWDLLDTIRFASAVAAMKCRKMGGRAGIPEVAEALLFMAEEPVRRVR